MNGYPPITVTFLGTGTSSGVPMIGCDCAVCSSADIKDKRLRSSILVQTAFTTIVVDTGPDFRTQMLQHQVKNLDAVLLTHSHKDHIAGLDDIRAYNYFQQRPMRVFATAPTLERVQEEFYYAFINAGFKGLPSIDLNTIAQENFFVNDLEVIPIPVWHHKMPVTGFRLGAFTYITDANRIDDSSKELIKGSEVLVVNTLRQEAHISHFTLQQGIDLGTALNIPTVYFTHISHQMGLHHVVNQSLPQGFSFAYDGLKINI